MQLSCILYRWCFSLVKFSHVLGVFQWMLWMRFQLGRFVCGLVAAFDYEIFLWLLSFILSLAYGARFCFHVRSMWSHSYWVIGRKWFLCCAFNRNWDGNSGLIDCYFVWLHFGVSNIIIHAWPKNYRKLMLDLISDFAQIKLFLTIWYKLSNVWDWDLEENHSVSLL